MHETLLAEDTMKPNNIYQFRFYIKGISPLIWRRILLKGNHTLNDLHHVIQMCFDWTNYHLHEISIRGKTYGACFNFINHSEDSTQITIDSLHLRDNEKFLYEYNFNDDWNVEIRLESINTAVAKQHYPFCIAGSKAAPPEDCGGAASFVALDDYYSDYKIFEIIQDKLDELEPENIEDLRFTMGELKYWVKRKNFDLKRANTFLKLFSENDPRWQDYMDEVI